MELYEVIWEIWIFLRALRCAIKNLSEDEFNNAPQNFNYEQKVFLIFLKNI